MHSSTDRPPHGGNLTWASQLANCSPSAILDFSASINPLGPPPSAIATIQAHLADLNAYPDPHYWQLRSALGQFHQLPPDWILPGNGSAELLTWACRDLAALSAVDLYTPAFGDYKRALSAFNAVVCEHPLMDTLDGGQTAIATNWASLSPKQDPSHPRGVLLNNPHNPTGLLFPRDALQPLCDRYELVVVDEAFMDFLPPTSEASLIDCVQTYPNLVILRSLTKFYSLPGLRLGYAIAHPDRLARWQAWRDPWSVNVLAAAVGAVVVQDKPFQQQTWDWLATVKPRLLDGLAQFPGLFPYPGAANFVLVRAAASVIDLQTQLLQQHRILIRDCLSFPQLGDRYFRVAVRTEAENQRLVSGLTNILTAADGACA